MNKKFKSPPSACIDCWRLSHKECPEGYTEPNKSRIVCKNYIKDNNQATIQCRDCMRDYLGNCPETSDTQCEVIRGNHDCKSYYKRNIKQMNEQQKDIQENKGVKYDGDKPRVALVLGGFKNALIECQKISLSGFSADELAQKIFTFCGTKNIEDLRTATSMCLDILQKDLQNLDRGHGRSILGKYYDALISIAQVGTFGAKKYADNNWMSLQDGENRTIDAAMRHIMAYMSGEINNHEEFEKDGVKYTCDLPHLAHAAWELLACIEFARYRLGLESTVKEAQEKLCK